MQKFIGFIILTSLISLFATTANAETYFLKIRQNGTGNVKNFLQTCTPQTAPCTFMMPVKFKKNAVKNLLVLMNFDDSTHRVHLHFYWDKTALTTNNSRENYYTLFAETPEIKVFSSEIELYPPLPEDKKLDENSELSISEQPFATLQAQVTVATE